MDVIAEHRLVALFPDAGPVPVCLRVGRPVPHSRGDYVCAVQAEGLRLWQGRSEIFGVGSWHAPMLGLRSLQSMLATEIERGAVFHREGGEQPVSVKILRL